MQFVARYSEIALPKEDGRGSYHRFTIDVDMEAVRDHILHGRGGTPWSTMVIDEMLEAINRSAREAELSARLMSGR